jgi:serine/threonine protein kinase/tetratricopeptide (TPR) repeat protein
VQPANSDVTCQFDSGQVDSRSAADSAQTGEFQSLEAPAHTCHFDRADTGGPQPGKDTIPSEIPTLEGVLVPGYEILQELGRGGMGVVYKARHVRLQRLVALKMILAGAHAGASGLARFRAEAEAVAQLQHPNIVQIYETGEHEGRPYFSLEFVEGGSLEERLRESSLPPRAAAEVIETLARTMAVAHQRGIVHRDLKPANILLGVVSGQTTLLRKEQMSGAVLPGDHWARNTVPKIADFGLAKRVDDDSGQTHSGTILGTPSYMAPEQAEGKNRELGPPADIYALGAIFYELLASRPPFKAGNPIDTIRQVIEQEPVPPRQLEPGVPRDLETICLKCLQKDPARRYASATELADDLRRFLNDEPIRARPTPAWERAWKWSKRRPTLVALLGVSVAAAVALVLFIIWHNVSLQGELIQARAEERLAREREQEAIEAQRLSRIEAEGEKLFHDAQVAVAARDWASARLHLTKVLAAIGDEPRLKQQKAPAEALLGKVEKQLRVEADRQASQARFQQFVGLRDEALFLGCLYTGMDLAGNIKATRAVVQRALGVYAISVDKALRGPPALDAHLDDARKREVLADCYQLLLILAETEAQSALIGQSSDQPRGLREAGRLLKQALRFGPASRAYHLRQARYLRLLGDQAGAQREEKAAAGLPIRHVLDHFLVGDEYYRRTQFKEALEEFNRVLHRQPSHFWAQYLGALCLLRLHRPAEATALLGACLAQRGDFVWIYLLRGFAHAELLAFDAAEADFQKALQLRLDESSRYVLFVNRGVLRVRQSRLDDAISDLKMAINLKPREYQAYVNLALAYRRQKKLDAALKQLDRAIDIEPKLADLYRRRARLQLERKELTLALADFDQAIRWENTSSPFSTEDHVERGRLLLRSRKYAEALGSFDTALKRQKDHSLAQRLRAEALFQLGKYREVIEAFDRYLETGKPLESVYRGRGLARAALGQYPGAVDDYTKALELQPTSAVQTYRGWAHLVCEAPKLALRDFDLAIQLDPSNGDAHNGRGLVLANQGRYRDALDSAEQALRKGPRSPRLLYNAARICAQCGGSNEQRAIELIRQALALLPVDQRAAFWNANIHSDAAFQTIRRHRQFLRLEAEMSRRK